MLLLGIISVTALMKVVLLIPSMSSLMRMHIQTFPALLAMIEMRLLGIMLDMSLMKGDLYHCYEQ
jgi:hypothetical protein